MQQRKDTLERIKHLLNSEEGQYLVDELKAAWHKEMLLGGDPQQTAYNCALRDAYEFVKQLQSGEMIHE